MGSPANSSSLITSPRNPWPLPLSACSQPWLLRLRLMPMLSMATMAMATTSAMPTMATVMAWDTTAIPMPTMVTTTARGPLMLRLLPLLRPMLMLTTDTTVMPAPMPTDTTDTPVPTDTATPTAMDSDTTDKM